MFQKLTEHIYLRPCEFYTDRPNIGLICGGKRTLLFEAGNSAAHVRQMKQELSDGGLPQPELAAVSHWHWDHTFGMAAWGVPVIACGETDRMLRTVETWAWDDASMARRLETGEDILFCEEMIRREYPNREEIRVQPADIVFDRALRVDLGGGVECLLLRAGGPHAADSVICYVPSDRFLFLGDANGKDLYGQPWHFDLAHEEDLVPTLAALPYDQALVDQLIRVLDTLDFDLCVGGHAAPMSREELYRSLLL